MGSIFWKTRDIGLASYSNNLSTSLPILASREGERIMIGFVMEAACGYNVYVLSKKYQPLPHVILDIGLCINCILCIKDAVTLWT